MVRTTETSLAITRLSTLPRDGQGDAKTSHGHLRQTVTVDSSSPVECSDRQSGCSRKEELLCQRASPQTADLSAGTVTAADPARLPQLRHGGEG